jgi:hypothetical protein
MSEMTYNGSTFIPGMIASATSLQTLTHSPSSLHSPPSTLLPPAPSSLTPSILLSILLFIQLSIHSALYPSAIHSALFVLLSILFYSFCSIPSAPLSKFLLFICSLSMPLSILLYSFFSIRSALFILLIHSALHSTLYPSAIHSALFILLSICSLSMLLSILLSLSLPHSHNPHPSSLLNTNKQTQRVSMTTAPVSTPMPQTQGTDPQLTWGWSGQKATSPCLQSRSVACKQQV